MLYFQTNMAAMLVWIFCISVDLKFKDFETQEKNNNCETDFEKGVAWIWVMLIKYAINS